MDDMEFEMRLVLASASPRRYDLLTQVGLFPKVMPSKADETIDGMDPEQAVKELSLRKAIEIAAKCQERDSIVIGADTIVAAGGEMLGKPVDETDAVRMLKLIEGKTHQVYTGVTLIAADSGTKITFAEQTNVSVYPMTEQEIAGYIKTGEPLDKAGAYGIQGRFAAYISSIHGDFYNVVGLPVGRVCRELKKFR